MKFDIYDLGSFTSSFDQLLMENFSPFWAVAIEMVIIGIAILAFYAVVGLTWFMLNAKSVLLCNAGLAPTGWARTDFSKPLPTSSSC